MVQKLHPSQTIHPHNINVSDQNRDITGCNGDADPVYQPQLGKVLHKTKLCSDSQEYIQDMATGTGAL